MKSQPIDGIDLTVAQTLRLGMDSGTFLLIEYVYGFELFGSYETWRGGWRVTDPTVRDFRHNRQGTFQLTVESARIEDAITQWATARAECQRIAADITVQARETELTGAAASDAVTRAFDRLRERGR